MFCKWQYHLSGHNSPVHHCMVGADMYESYRERECWDVVKAPPQGTVLNIVRAANSDRYNKDHMQVLRCTGLLLFQQSHLSLEVSNIASGRCVCALHVFRLHLKPMQHIEPS